MLVKDVMTKKVVCLRPKESLASALTKLAKYKISGAPVVEKNRVVGILSESDVLKTIDVYTPSIRLDSESLFALVLAAIKSKNEFEAIRKTLTTGNILVENIMKKNVVSIEHNKTVLDAARMMNKYGINRLVVTASGKPLGIIARADIIRALGCSKK